MNCPSCNTQVSPGIAFCPECGTRLPTSAAPLRVLQNRYELTKKLGQGGMGAVYLAADRRLSTVRWAVKEMSDAQITSPLERQQAGDAFKYEAELLARLSHPNLPRVTDHFTEDGKNYLVMEFVPGETLHAYAQREGYPRPLPEVQGWALQLCDVLAYLHAQQPPVIFRDLKPANVMITPEGQLKLIDFGIARLFKAGQTKDTQAYGTMGYSAPEQYGRGQTDARSDIYSLGVLLHHLLSGHDPAMTPFRMPPLTQLNPALPADLAATIARATDNDPEQRFSSIGEFRRALLGTGYLVQTAAGAAAAPAIGSTIAITPQSGAMLGNIPTLPPHPATGGALPPSTQAGSTTLARVGFWLGTVSAVWMLVALIFVIIGAGTGDPNEVLSGFGVLLALPPTILGPTAAIIGAVAFFGEPVRNSRHGRRDALIGIISGIMTLFLCCGVAAALPDSDDDNGMLRSPAATTFYDATKAVPHV
ncbi:MAG: protein kinase [Oscillochloris sp.]|nr:protein kinase [Oscillochloris sp.]